MARAGSTRRRRCRKSGSHLFSSKRNWLTREFCRYSFSFHRGVCLFLKHGAVGGLEVCRAGESPAALVSATGAVAVQLRSATKIRAAIVRSIQRIEDRGAFFSPRSNVILFLKRLFELQFTKTVLNRERSRYG